MSDSIFIPEAIKELHRAFDIVNHEIYDDILDMPVITIESSRKKNILAYFEYVPLWVKQGESVPSQYQITFVAEALADTPDNIVGRMIHECVHYWMIVYGKFKPSKSGRHDKKFVEYAELAGLDCFPHSRWGFVTEPGVGALALAKKIDLKPECFTSFKTVKSPDPAPKNVFKYKCEACNYSIQASRIGLQLKCLDCEGELVMDYLSYDEFNRVPASKWRFKAARREMPKIVKAIQDHEGKLMDYEID